MLTSGETGILKIVDPWAQQSGISMDVVMEGDDVDALKRATAMGLGLSVLPLFVVKDYVGSGKLEIVDALKLPLRWKVYFVHSRERGLSATARLFLDFVKARNKIGT